LIFFQSEKLGSGKTLSEQEVAGVTFSDSDFTPVPKFLNPGPDPVPAIFQIL